MNTTDDRPKCEDCGTEMHEHVRLASPSGAERVRLASPYGYALVIEGFGYRRLTNGATGTVVAGQTNHNLLRVSFDYPDGGTYDLPSHWFERIGAP